MNSDIKRKNPFAKALENKNSSGFGAFGGGGFGKSENGTGMDYL